MFYPYGFVRRTKCICWAIGNNYLIVITFLSLQLNEFMESDIKQKLSLVQITCVTATAHKKIISLFCVSGILRSPPQSAVQVKSQPTQDIFKTS